VAKIPPATLTAKEQEGVDLNYLLFIHWQCCGFTAALTRGKALLAQTQTYATTELGFADLFSAISFAANVGKMLWPAPTDKTRHLADPRGVHLCALIGITVKDPILSNYKVRNTFEHLDERLDEWAAATNRNFGIHALSSIPLMGGPGASAQETFDRYDPKGNVLHMQADSIDLTALQQSVDSIKAKALAEIRRIQPLAAQILFP
jgi:hypothetical protein